MNSKINSLEQRIFAETDGSKLSTHINRLIQLADDQVREHIMNILIQYVHDGRILHFRAFVINDIIKMIQQNEEQYASFFEWTITQPQFAYWSVDGLLKTSGAAAYPMLIDVIQNKEAELAVRAKAIKEIAVASKQLFDRDLPADPGHWRQEHVQLRMGEVLAWASNGYAAGTGHAAPQQHPSLRNPITRLERAAARLEARLAKARADSQADPANPANYLMLADEQHLTAIEAAYKLPQNYRDFLKLYSPLKVWITIDDDFSEQLHLYGAAELCKRQNGYAYHAVTQQTIVGWPANLVVIADQGGDPFCIDVTAAVDDDAPIYFAAHGCGAWEFERYADSFVEFLEAVGAG